MENESVSLIYYVPSFARGLNILLVHDDTLSLVYLSSLLEQYSFKVTTTNDTSAAASMICDHECKFKLVMAKSNMPCMDALSFLDVVHEKDIPVIFISSGGFDDLTRKALTKGSCYFLQEPIKSSDLKNLWQLVYHPKVDPLKETQNVNSENKVCNPEGSQHTKITQVYGANGEGNHDDKGGKLKEKRTVDNQAMPGSLIATQCQVHRVNGKRNHDDSGGKLKENRTIDNLIMPSSWSSAQMNFDNNYHESVFSESRRVWTPELHQKFTEAVHALGENDARPKAILKRMKEPYLTVRQVASHLQKYKARLKQIENDSKSDLPPVNTSSCLSGTAQIPSPSEGFSLETEDLPVPPATLNESQNQNQFLMNNAETQDTELDILQLLETQEHDPNLATTVENQNQFLMNNAETQDIELDIVQLLETQEHPTLASEMTSQSLDSTVENQNQFLIDNAETQQDIELDILQLWETQEHPTLATEFTSQSLDSTVENQNLIVMNNAQDIEFDILELLETQDNPTLATEWSSQSLDSTVEHSVLTAVSVDQDQPATEFDDIMKMLAEDCDSFDWFGNGANNPPEVDQYTEMLKTVLDGDNFNPPEFDIDDPNRSSGLNGP